MKPFCTVLLSLTMLSVFGQKASSKNPYPETRKGEVVDTYFGTEVPDPYRWLEDDLSEETADWVKRQNEVTFGYLEGIPYRKTIQERLEALLDYEKVGSPFKEGGYTYYYKNDGLQNHYVLYRRKDDGAETVFLDPNGFSEDATKSLAGVSFTKDGSRAAYLVQEGGSDWRKAVIIDTETMEQLGDTLYNLKFTGLSWRGNEGLYYSSYDKPEGSDLSAKTDQHKLYYHKLGTPQEQDVVVFGGDPEEKHRYVGAGLSEDERFLFVSASVSTDGNKLFLRDLQAGQEDWTVIAGTVDQNIWPVDSDGTLLYLETDRDAPNGRVVVTDASDPGPENWTDLIPEKDQALSAGSGGGYLFATYLVDAVSRVEQYDYQGRLVRKIELPGVGSANGFGGKKEDKTFYYRFANYNTPSSIYRYDVEKGSSERYWTPKIDFDTDAYVSKQVFYTSKDGTRVPLIITHKKGLVLDGSNPTLLYGYGGFNVSLTPSFSSTRAVWMEMGGVLAVANLRGGGEYGKEWHDAGTKLQKQNVFDDFIAAAEYLIDKDYTSSDKLAVQGGSNGGLLVGAVMTQRPELMRVALPAVGVMDMLRYHTFTAGAGWAYDYGTAEDDQEMFEYLKGYSPVHNVREGVSYPATLVTTADHDDRVVPAHSFKFAAELQAKQAGALPTLIRIETNSGHGSSNLSKAIEQSADIFAFTLYNMGYQQLPQAPKGRIED